MENYYEETLNILQKIEDEPGKLNKTKLLQEQFNNETLKAILEYTYNPFKIYGIKKVPKSNAAVNTDSSKGHFEELIATLDALNAREYTGNRAIRKVGQLFDNLSFVEFKWFTRILKKDLKIGATSKTINGVWNNLIPTFEVQLAHSFDKYKGKVEGKEFFVTEKLDGVRCIIFNDQINPKAFKRSGKEYDGLPEVYEEIVKLPKGVYDGEILSIESSTLKDRETLQNTMKKVGAKGAQTGLVFNIFDYLEADEWEDKSGSAYHLRRGKMDAFKESEHVKVVPVLYRGNDLTMIPRLLNEVEEKGKEGLMINLSEGYYEKKRTQQLLKVKSMESFDGKIIEVIEGEFDTKYQGMLGALKVSYKDSFVYVGSGFSDSERKTLWKNKEKILGRIVEVQYFRESENEKGNKSVSFPVFKTIRQDKTEVNYES